MTTLAALPAVRLITGCGGGSSAITQTATTPNSNVDALLLSSSDYLLLQNSDKLLLE